MLGLLPLREAPTTEPAIPQLMPPRFLTCQQMHKHCFAQATSQYQTVTSVPECQHCFNRDSIFNFILTTHDIFCLDFDRDPEGWEVPAKQIHKKSFIWKVYTCLTIVVGYRFKFAPQGNQGILHRQCHQVVEFFAVLISFIS